MVKDKGLNCKLVVVKKVGGDGAAAILRGTGAAWSAACASPVRVPSRVEPACTGLCGSGSCARSVGLRMCVWMPRTCAWWQPEGAPVSERAIPTAIFSADETTKRHYLKQWLRDPGMTDFDIRDVLDWGYYTTRLSG
jgi:hypothetical protein